MTRQWSTDQALKYFSHSTFCFHLFWANLRSPNTHLDIKCIPPVWMDRAIFKWKKSYYNYYIIYARLTEVNNIWRTYFWMALRGKKRMKCSYGIWGQADTTLLASFSFVSVFSSIKGLYTLSPGGCSSSGWWNAWAHDKYLIHIWDQRPHFSNNPGRGPQWLIVTPMACQWGYSGQESMPSHQSQGTAETQSDTDGKWQM